MPTKTKTKERPPMPDWQTEMSEELYRQEQRSRAAMALLLSAADGAELTSEELAFLRAAGIDDATRRREVARLTRVVKLYQAAGTSAQRKAAADRLALVQAELGPIVAKAQAEIDRLQGEIRKAESDLLAAKAEAERRDNAAQQLTSESVLPEFVRGQLKDNHKAESDCEASRTVRETEQRLKVIAGVLKLTDADGMKLHAQAQQMAGRDLFTRTGDGGAMINPKVCPMKWAEYLAQLREEVPGLEAQLAAANKELEIFRREAQQLREFWLTPEIEEQLEQMGVL